MYGAFIGFASILYGRMSLSNNFSNSRYKDGVLFWLKQFKGFMLMLIYKPCDPWDAFFSLFSIIFEMQYRMDK